MVQNAERCDKLILVKQRLEISWGSSVPPVFQQLILYPVFVRRGTERGGSGSVGLGRPELWTSLRSRARWICQESQVKLEHRL